ncbi:homoserine O-succinyltransferase [Liquorilactobacillus mali]|uniref:homoserine O-acetyltransferase/O-succinyltransferase family protein n=1 Tax=Liquorilactobacillus mali TaxID=1618 RepID=UPI0026508898|nr:homoserine O-succinyltransferase [Liquorilactobacillus mali]MDN7144923.1 homoserine O-succinyltransferase [Liquorilactobacillus mali]
MESETLNIGVLNVMHDKSDTQRRFNSVLKQQDIPVKVTYFYPTMHYQGRTVPEEVSHISEPLDLLEVGKMDAFIVTGAPLEKIDFQNVTYWDELKELFQLLKKLDIPQLYVCWGAMAAANFYYGIEKQMLAHKLFGIYRQKVFTESKLLKGLPIGFTAPHARYAELNHEQIRENKNLEIKAISETNHLFLVEAKNEPQVFLFAHLEYGRDALAKEYQRELKAYPDQAETLARPQNYYEDFEQMKAPIFSWADTQVLFFKNWITQVKKEYDSKSKKNSDLV